MLIVSRENKTALIVGIDPGTTNLGLSKIVFNVETFEAISIKAFTIEADKLPSDEQLGLLYGDRQRRISALSDHLYFLFQDLEPYAFACESPFYSQRRPNAYGSLVEVLCAIREAVIKHTKRKPLYLTDPPSVKRAVGAAGNANKDDVLKAILRNEKIISVCEDPITGYDEHSLDAIAVGYWLLTEFRNGTMNVKTAL